MSKGVIKFSVINSFNAKTSLEVIRRELSSIVNEIWKHGLTEQHFYNLISIFTERKDLNLNERKLILECLIPRFVVNEEAVVKLLLWFFSTYIRDPEASACLLLWMARLVEYKLIDEECLKKFYGQLVTAFQSECLVPPLSRLLLVLTCAETVNKRITYLVQEFYKEFKSNHLKCLIWEVNKYRPQDIVIKFTSKPHLNKQMNDFDKALIKAAKAQGIHLSTVKIEDEKPIAASLPGPAYLDTSNQPILTKLTDIKSTKELGQCVIKQTLKLPHNPTSLLSSKIGLIYIQLMGPSEQLLASIKGLLLSRPTAILPRLSDLQSRMRHGLPIITKFLAKFLLTWDGVESQELVYELIQWIYFDKFSDLYNMILKPLFRLYVCSHVDTKVAIMHSLNCLIINMVTVHMERLNYVMTKFHDIVPRQNWLDCDPLDTFIKLCIFIRSLINNGLAMEGLEFTPLLLESVTFYNIVLNLQLTYKLAFLISPVPGIIFAALISKNHVVLSEVGALLVRYKKEVIPFIENSGLSEQFLDNIQEIYEVSNIMFNHLWLGEEISTSINPEQIQTSAINRSRLSKERVRQHPGVAPLIRFLAHKLEIDPTNVEPYALLQMLLHYSEGLGEFLQFHINENTLE